MEIKSINQNQIRHAPIRPYVAPLSITDEKIALGTITKSRILSVDASSIIYSDEVDGIFQDINAKNFVVSESSTTNDLTVN